MSRIRRVRRRWAGAVVAAVVLVGAGCGSEPEEVISDDGGLTPGAAPSSGGVASTEIPTVTTSTPEAEVAEPVPAPSVEGFVVSPPVRFEVAELPSNATVQVDREGEARIAMRFFYVPDTLEQLTVTVHNSEPGEFEQFLKDFDEYEGSIEELEPEPPYVRLLQLEPDDPDLPASDRHLAGVLADGQVVYVIGDQPWDELRSVLRTVEGRPGSLRVETFDDAVASGVDAVSDEELENIEEEGR